MTPKIVLSPQVALNLESLVSATKKQEFSGLGFCKMIDGDIHVYDIVLLDVGSRGYTEISVQKLLEIERPDKSNIRLWFHRHPIEGWSMTDIDTIVTAPLGGIPEIVRWSASIVRTPTHWIGRIDNHVRKTFQDVEVTPNVSQMLIVQAENLLDEYFRQHEHLKQAVIHQEPPFGMFVDPRQSSFIDELDDVDDLLDLLDDELYSDPFYFADETQAQAILNRVRL